MSTTSPISTPASYFDQVLRTLQTSGFYWGAITATQSKTLLMHKPIGTFLVRASSDPKHLFTLTLRTESDVTHIRIIMNNGKFSLDQIETIGPPTQPANSIQRAALRFDCVVKMLHFYRLFSTRTGQQMSANIRKHDMCRWCRPSNMIWRLKVLRHKCCRLETSLYRGVVRNNMGPLSCFLIYLICILFHTCIMLSTTPTFSMESKLVFCILSLSLTCTMHPA